MKNTSRYFGKNNRFENAWSNAEWTLPSVGNLLTGKYTSNHLCWKILHSINPDLTDLTK